MQSQKCIFMFAGKPLSSASKRSWSSSSRVRILDCVLALPLYYLSRGIKRLGPKIVVCCIEQFLDFLYRSLHLVCLMLFSFQTDQFVSEVCDVSILCVLDLSRLALQSKRQFSMNSFTMLLLSMRLNQHIYHNLLKRIFIAVKAVIRKLYRSIAETYMTWATDLFHMFLQLDFSVKLYPWISLKHVNADLYACFFPTLINIPWIARVCRCDGLFLLVFHENGYCGYLCYLDINVACGGERDQKHNNFVWFLLWWPARVAFSPFLFPELFLQLNRNPSIYIKNCL